MRSSDPILADLQTCKRPVIFFANGLGDTILSLPALRALTTLLPEPATLVCDLDIYATFFSELPLRRAVETRMERNAPDWTREFRVDEVADAIVDCDLLISLVPWHSDSLRTLMQRLRPLLSIGFFDDFHFTVPLNFAKHAADLAFDIPRYCDSSLRIEDYAYPPRFRKESLLSAQRICAAIPSSYNILVVHADTGQNKMWLADRFVSLLDEFLTRHPEFFVLVVGSIPQPIDRGRFAHRIIACYGLPLPISISLVGQADLFLGVDSCMLHAADLYHVPSVGMFGESSSLQYGFRFTVHRIVRKGTSMKDIDAADVLDALEDLQSLNAKSTGVSRLRL